ncbi:MAG: energy transducer TonB [Endomicrobiaceae bacterium]|nr:energy transducer TonB [Endomicrobiaceae bacterium]
MQKCRIINVINNFYVCVVISFFIHICIVSFIVFYFSSGEKNKYFEVVFEDEKKIFTKDKPNQVKREKISCGIKQKNTDKNIISESFNKISETYDENDKNNTNKLSTMSSESFIEDESQNTLVCYQKNIKQKIQREKKYPRLALRLGHEGKARVSFFVLSSGEITDLKLINSSGFKELDAEALDAVRHASPFSVFPEGIKNEKIGIEIDVLFFIIKNNK